jgi:hypothetical protein
MDVTLPSFVGRASFFVAVQKIFSKNPKVLSSPSVNGYRNGVEGFEKNFATTLKFSKFVTLIKKDARHREAGSPGSTQFQLPHPPLFS